MIGFLKWIHCVALVFTLSLFSRNAFADFAFEYNGHSYLIVQQERTWQSAAMDAVSRQVAGMPGYLTIIESAAENKTIFDQLIANIPIREYANTQAPDGGNGYFVWIAANDLAVEGKWIWDGEGDGVGQQFYQGLGNAGGGSVGGFYNNWGTFNGGPWEPDNGAGGLQDAGGIALANYPRGLASQWNDVRADNTLYYVVEFNAVPEPTAVVLLTVAVAWAKFFTRRQRTLLVQSNHSSVGSNAGTGTIRARSVPIARWRQPGLMRMASPARMAWRSPSSCISPAPSRM
jgi:hypothetical protein